MEKHPSTVIVFAGDMNRLDISRLGELTGWNALVDFPTRGNARLDRLDNCLTNRTKLFSECLAFNMLIKTDHSVTAELTARRVCTWHSMRRTGTMLSTPTISMRLCTIMERIIHSHMNSCMPLKTVSLSSRPLVSACRKLKQGSRRLTRRNLTS